MENEELIDPCYPKGTEVKLLRVNPARALAIEANVMLDEGYRKRHAERMAKIEAIQQEDHDDYSKVAEQYCRDIYGVSCEEAIDDTIIRTIV